jgi:capsular polysaccharide synthesis CpsB/CapC-like protein
MRVASRQARPLLEGADWSRIAGSRVIDIHSHILPEVDDGPKSWDVAVEMCGIAAADGITYMVAAPHANDRYAYERTYLTELLDQLRGKLERGPQLSLGCDLHLSYENLERVLDQPHIYTIGQTNYLLVELSNFSVPIQITDCFTKLGDRGVTPILTHPERNPILQQRPQRILEWAEQGSGENARRLSRAGCSIARRFIFWPAMLMTTSAGCRFFPQRAQSRKSWWGLSMPRLWSRATLQRWLTGSRFRIVRGR